MTLLQQSSFHESTASWLQSAQKKFLGKTVGGRELSRLVIIKATVNSVYLQRKLFQVGGEGRRLGVCGVGHDGAKPWRKPL